MGFSWVLLLFDVPDQDTTALACVKISLQLSITGLVKLWYDHQEILGAYEKSVKNVLKKILLYSNRTFR